MACDFYDEATNGLKMVFVGLAIGAIAWFVAGSGVKEGYEKRKREREREQHEERREQEKERRKIEAEERAAERKAAAQRGAAAASVASSLWRSRR